MVFSLWARLVLARFEQLLFLRMNCFLQQDLDNLLLRLDTAPETQQTVLLLC